MITIKSILCPTDLSPASDEALRYAIALARAYEAKLIVCHCSEPVAPVTDVLREEFSKQVEAAVRQWMGVGQCRPAEYERIIVAGEPHEAIPRVAAESGVDLIVIRSRRRSRAASLLGSTAEAVCRTAPCPVLVTHPREREWVGATTCEIDLRKVLVAQDFSNDSELALQMALSLAQEYEAELHLLHVLPVALVPAVPHLPINMESEFQRAAGSLARSVPNQAHLWCKVFQAVKAGPPYRAILDYAAEREIDLICMGVRGAGFAMRALFGSNADRVLRQAPCPVLIARPLKPTRTAFNQERSKSDFQDGEHRLA